MKMSLGARMGLIQQKEHIGPFLPSPLSTTWNHRSCVAAEWGQGPSLRKCEICEDRTPLRC